MGITPSQPAIYSPLPMRASQGPNTPSAVCRITTPVSTGMASHHGTYSYASRHQVNGFAMVTANCGGVMSRARVNCESPGLPPETCRLEHEFSSLVSARSPIGSIPFCNINTCDHFIVITQDSYGNEIEKRGKIAGVFCREKHIVIELTDGTRPVPGDSGARACIERNGMLFDIGIVNTCFRVGPCGPCSTVLKIIHFESMASPEITRYELEIQKKIVPKLGHAFVQFSIKPEHVSHFRYAMGALDFANMWRKSGTIVDEVFVNGKRWPLSVRVDVQDPTSTHQNLQVQINDVSRGKKVKSTTIATVLIDRIFEDFRTKPLQDCILRAVRNGFDQSLQTGKVAHIDPPVGWDLAGLVE